MNKNTIKNNRFYIYTTYFFVIIVLSTTMYADLQVYLPLDGNLLDAAGGDHNGVLVNGVFGTHQYVAGKFDQGLELTGTHGSTGNDYVAINYTLTNEGSIALWFKPATFYDYNTILDNSVNQDDWELWLYSSGEFAARIQSPQYLRGYYMNADTWYHIAVTWKRNSVNPTYVDNELYIDGEWVASNTDAAWVAPGNAVYLGGGNSGNTAGDGVWDEVRIYNHVLTTEEIRALLPRKLLLEPVSLNVTEGNNEIYNVMLDYAVGQEPTDDVIVNITGDPNIRLNEQDAGVGLSLTFLPGSYGAPQVVTVTAVDDTMKQGDRNTNLAHSANSDDPAWAAVDEAMLPLLVQDNDYDPADCGLWGYAPMDFNHDCYVDFVDLSMFITQWLRCTQPGDANCQPVSPIKVVAHRGYSDIAPENTIASCNASRGFADWVEFDVRETADGHLILMHDATVDRTTDGSGSVSAMTLNTLRTLDAGSWFSASFDGELVPLMSEAVLAVMPDMVPCIERKAGAAQLYVDLIQSLRMENDVVIIAFDWNFLADVEALAPAISTGALSSGALTAQTIQNIQSQGIDFIDWAEGDVNAATVALVHSFNMELCVWTVDDAGRMAELISWGIDGITTNNPELLRNIISP